MTSVVDLAEEREARAPAPSGFEDMPVVMSPKTLSEQIEVSTTQLSRWRDDGDGPAYSQPPESRIIRYARVDVIAWLKQHRHEPSK